MQSFSARIDDRIHRGKIHETMTGADDRRLGFVGVIQAEHVPKLVHDRCEEIDAAGTPPKTGGIDVDVDGLSNGLTQLRARQIGDGEAQAVER